MEIRQTKRLEPGAAPIFLLSGPQDLAKHVFFKLLEQEDQRLLRAFAAKADLKEGAVHSVFLPSGTRALLLGKAKPAQWNRRRALLAMRLAVGMARREGFDTIQVCIDDFRSRGGPTLGDLAELMAVQFNMANFEFVSYRTAPEEGWRMVHNVFVHSHDSRSLAARLARGLVIGQEVNGARTLVNTPGGDMTPAKLAAEAVALGKKHGFKVEVLAEADMKKLGMGGVLGVGKGSGAGPRFIVIEYMNGSKRQKPLVLVGKGITFDSGGLNLKPEKSMHEMHMDMSGGAAVIHAIAALARLKTRTNVVGLIPAAENMVSGGSYRPGDLLKTLSGKTIEVLNTDAEGRIVLADALTYAERYNPRLVVDVATLTGAAVVALGQRASALFATDTKLEKLFRDLGEETGDYVWPLPLWEEYEREIKGTFGDVANLGKNDRYGGAITAAAFLWQFAKKYPWVHLDIAPRMTPAEGDHLAKGAMGTPVALLVRLAGRA